MSQKKSTPPSTDDGFQIIVQSSDGEHLAMIDGELAKHVVKLGMEMFLLEALRKAGDEQE